jgi:hypothetical protein
LFLWISCSILRNLFAKIFKTSAEYAQAHIVITAIFELGLRTFAVVAMLYANGVDVLSGLSVEGAVASGGISEFVLARSHAPSISLRQLQNANFSSFGVNLPQDNF